MTEDFSPNEMSFSDDERAQMDAMFEDSDDSGETEEKLQDGGDSEVIEEEGEEQETAPAAESESLDSDSVENRIPYSRFKDVNEARKYAEKQLEAERLYFKEQQAEYERQLQEFKERQSQGQREPADDLDFLDEKPPAGLTREEVMEMIQGYESPYELEVEKMQMERELSAAAEKYPGVSRDVLLNAVMSDETGLASIDELARGIHLWQEEIRQAAIDEYLKENQPKKPEPKTKRTAELGSSRADVVDTGELVSKSEREGLSPVEQGTLEAKRWLKKHGKRNFFE